MTPDGGHDARRFEGSDRARGVRTARTYIDVGPSPGRSRSPSTRQDYLLGGRYVSLVVLELLGLLLVVAFVVAAVGSVPFAIGTLLLSWRVAPFSRALRYATLGVGVLVTLVAVAVATVTPEAGVVVALVGGLVGVALWVVPVSVARTVLVWWGVPAERALRDATLALPVALVAALLVAFGDFGRYNVTFLTGVEAALAWTVLALVVFFGPAGVALVFERLFGARAE